jgi:hypothetical protein
MRSHVETQSVLHRDWSGVVAQVLLQEIFKEIRRKAHGSNVHLVSFEAGGVSQKTERRYKRSRSSGRKNGREEEFRNRRIGRVFRSVRGY